MKSESKIKQWQEGRVDRSKDHFELRYGSVGEARPGEWAPIALVGPPADGIVNVQFLAESGDAKNEEALNDVRKEIQYYLIEKGEPNPWAYAKYRCSTSANLYSKVHWSFAGPGLLSK